MLYSNRRIIRLRTPFSGADLQALKAGDEVLLSGMVFTARDQAHRRLVDLLREKSGLPLDLNGQAIYYCGPTKTPPGKVIGSCGPTTSSRMDRFVGPLLEAGLKGMIGKGRRSDEVRRSIQQHKAVYFLATGGAGALLSKRVVSARPFVFEDLGPEAVYQLTLKDFPLLVGIDTKGRDVFEI